MSEQVLNRKQRKKKKFKFSEISKRRKILVFMIIVLSLISIFLYSQVIKPLVMAGNPVSILLVGSDTSEFREESKKGTKPEKTDSLILLTFNPDEFRFVTTSIPRDTAIDDACKQQRAKVNEIYAINDNDIDCLTDSVSNYLNVPIDYYAKVNLDQIVDIIDVVGPLEIVAHAADGSIGQATVDDSNYYTWNDGQTYQMDAEEALTYSRARHDSEVDYGRGKRQQQVLKAMAKNILNEGINPKIIKSLFGMVDTDMELMLMKEYYDYAKLFQKITTDLSDSKLPAEEELPKSAWDSMMKYFGYKKSDVSKFEKYLFENYSKDEISAYFFESIQIVNEKYNGFYVTPDEQREEISNKLRANLGLKKEKPKDYEFNFAVNKFPCEVTATNSCTNGGYTTEDQPTEEEINNANKDQDKKEENTDQNQEVDNNTGDDTSTNDNTDGNQQETTPPTLNVVSNQVEVEINSPEIDYISTFGVSATNSAGEDISANIQVNSSVDYTTPGTYQVVFTVTDANGQTTSSTVSVIVKDSAAGAAQ